MKKDIPIPRVNDVAVAIIPDKDVASEFWQVYLINLKGNKLTNVLINSTGYGEVKGENVRTTTLRYYFESVAPDTFVKIEVLQKELKELANEYWVSFTKDGQMYDKKYIFVKGTLSEDNFTKIPLIDDIGVMIK